MKVKDMNFGREDFCQRVKKKRPFVSTPKQKYNPLSEQGNMKNMLTLCNSAECLRHACLKSILFSSVPKPDIDFATGLAKQQTDEVPETLCSIYHWISISANVEDFFANLFVNMSKENISKIELLRRGHSNNKLWYNYRKGVITASKSHFALTKMNKILKPTSA